ncbi:MAG: DUF6580 family putative transport protein [Planctomycetota bacterium]
MNEQARPADGTVGQPAPGGTFDRSPVAKVLLAVAWLLLVTLAVVGRAWQPAPHVTPLAAVSLAAGALFPSAVVAASVPVAALAIGNLFLPPYGSLTMAVIVYAALAWPVVLGRLGLLGQPGHGTRWMNVVAGALASSLVFFFATNVAHWLLTDMYPRTAGGLLACLVAALPFHRWMPVGDVAWSLAVFGLLAGMTALANGFAARRLAPARAVRRPGPTSAA